MLAIAHRSGNTVAGLREALDLGVDLVEADVHAHRGVLEMRHHKSLGPRHLWDKWELVARRDFLQVELSELLDELGDDPRLMIDLKGTRPGLATAVSDVLRMRAPDLPLTVCTKQWGMLDAFDPVVRRVLSVANRRSLTRLRRRLAAPVEPVAEQQLRSDRLLQCLFLAREAGQDLLDFLGPEQSAQHIDRRPHARSRRCADHGGDHAHEQFPFHHPSPLKLVYRTQR